jgi:hypothetical protein
MRGGSIENDFGFRSRARKHVLVTGEGTAIGQRAVHASSTDGSAFIKSNSLESLEGGREADEQNKDYNKRVQVQSE